MAIADTPDAKRRRYEMHGMKSHPLYKKWCAIKTRCFNPNCKDYHHYGGRGIVICEEWRNSFAAFLRDMGERPTMQHTIERIDNSKGYEPGNCRWATRAEQTENTRQTRLITFCGVTLSLAKWAKRIGVSSGTLKSRIDDLGWSIERALTTPGLGRGYASHRRAAS